MKIKYFLINLLLVSLIALPSCKNPFRYTDAREVPVDGKERVRKNIDEGRGISFGKGPKGGGVFDFASSNELWRASIEVLDFVSFTNASYSGGILITDWFSGNTNSEEKGQRDLKITVRFLSNESNVGYLIYHRLLDRISRVIFFVQECFWAYTKTGNSKNALRPQFAPQRLVCFMRRVRGE